MDSMYERASARYYSAIVSNLRGGLVSEDSSASSGAVPGARDMDNCK